jgi:hypothetical protein
LMAQMSYLRYKLPIRWHADPLPRTAARLLRQSLASAPALAALNLAWKVLRHSHLPPAILETLFWTIVGSYQILGLREGIRQHGPIPPAEERHGS